MATFSFFIDPINGNDGDTGLAPATAFATVIPALLQSGFTPQQDGSYAKGSSGDDSISLYFVRGTSLVPPLTIHAGGEFHRIAFRLLGANNALVLFTGKISTTDSVLSFSSVFQASVNYGIKGLRISQLADVGASALLYSSAGRYGVNEGFVNCVVRGYDFIAKESSAPASYVTSEGVITPTGQTSFACLLGDANDLQELGPYSWVPTPTKILLGLGAILPQPGGDYEYTPSVAQDFIAEGWANDPSYGGGTAKINTSFISIDSGASARALGPVINYPEGISFSTTHVSAVEDETKPPGSKEVIDSTELDSVRTIDVRSSETLFAQTDPTPEWVPIHKDSSHALVSGKYIQFRVTLTTEGV
jgi:hypothetical protein